MKNTLLTHTLVALTSLGVGYAAAPAARSLAWPASPAPVPNAAPLPLQREATIPEQCRPWVERIEELAATVSSLQEELEVLGAASVQRDTTAPPGSIVPETAPLEGPPHWQERAGEQELVRVFRQAVAESGYDVELASVDCTEYPCILYGHTADDPQILNEFLASSAFDALAALERRVFTWGRAQVADREEERRYFGLSFYPAPSDQAEAERLGQRLQFRTQLMWDAVDHSDR